MDDSNHTVYTQTPSHLILTVLGRRDHSILQLRTLRLRELKQFPRVTHIPWRESVHWLAVHSDNKKLVNF